MSTRQAHLAALPLLALLGTPASAQTSAQDPAPQNPIVQGQTWFVSAAGPSGPLRTTLTFANLSQQGTLTYGFSGSDALNALTDAALTDGAPGAASYNSENGQLRFLWRGQNSSAYTCKVTLPQPDAESQGGSVPLRGELQLNTRPVGSCLASMKGEPPTPAAVQPSMNQAPLNPAVPLPLADNQSWEVTSGAPGIAPVTVMTGTLLTGTSNLLNEGTYANSSGLDLLAAVSGRRGPVIAVNKTQSSVLVIWNNGQRGLLCSVKSFSEQDRVLTGTLTSAPSDENLGPCTITLK